MNAGYEQYEVSNFALPDYKCIHNINYWKGGEYLAFGPSGHGYFNGERYWNFRSLNKYYELIKSNQLPIEGSEALNNIDLMNESVMLGLRAEGLDFNEFEKKFGLKLELLAGDLFADWQNEGFCSYDNMKVRLNHKGYFICDVLVNQLLKLIDKYS
jgi:oxygen-independent coproporphyrinogen-3 oxidase